MCMQIIDTITPYSTTRDQAFSVPSPVPGLTWPPTSLERRPESLFVLVRITYVCGDVFKDSSIELSGGENDNGNIEPVSFK